MEKYEIIVSKGIRYEGELDKMGEQIWKDYNLNQYLFPHIFISLVESETPSTFNIAFIITVTETSPSLFARQTRSR